MKKGAPPARLKPYAVDWQAIADELRKHPNEDVLLSELGLEDTPRLRSLRNSARQGDIAALFSLGGVVFAMERNSRSIGGNTRQGDLWLRWEPDADPLTHYPKRALDNHRRAGRL